MRLVNISVLRPGEELSYAIKTQDGRVLLPANTMLTYNFIQRLTGFGISSVYINDDFFDEVSVRPCMSDDTKTDTLRALDNAFKTVGTKKYIDASQIKTAALNMTKDIKKAIANEPLGIINMYAISDSRCLHAINVASIVCALALEHGCETEIASDYVTASLLHDLHLKRMENDSDPTHAQDTKEYLKFVRDFSVRTYMAVGMHHERFDGTGREKIADEKISEGARMIAVADIYDSLLYGYGAYNKQDLNYAVEQLNNLAGKALDPLFVGYFNSSVAVYPTGSTVLLNNGYKAVVVAQNYKMPARPKVRLSMPMKADCIEINLMTNLTLFISKLL